MKISKLQNIDINRISTLIFDWGGVITNISPQLSIDAFNKLGHPNFEKYFDPKLEDNLFFRFEKGTVSPAEIYLSLNQEIGGEISPEKLDAALCAMLLDTPPIRLDVLQRLGSRFKLFLLSNTNIIHTTYYNKYLKETYNIDYPSLFHKVYYSYEMGFRKPSSEIFKEILNLEKLDADETLFLDDTEINIESARSLGMRTLLVSEDNTIEKIFSEQ